MKRIAIMVLALALVLSGVAASAQAVTVGIIQYATHPSLDNCTKGFIEGLAEDGYKEGDNLTIDFQNAMADMATGDMQAKLMVSQGHDMLVGVATPAAMSAYAATVDSGTPVIFVAVSDAVSAGIVESNEVPNTNCTGVSDILNLPEQVKMIRAFLPEAKKIGVVYTVSEPNSISHLSKLHEVAAEQGFEVAAIGITAGSEVATAAGSLIADGVDCFNNFTDNLVVENLPALLLAAEEAGIPVFGSEVEQVVNGCLATQGIDYVALGREAGKIAAKVLKGEADPATTPVGLIDEVTPAYNADVLAALALTLPAGYEAAQEVTQ